MANGQRKPLVLPHGEIKTPPIAKEGRVEAGQLVRRLQEGESIGMPLSRPMPGIGKRCHELRVRDGRHNWRIIHRLDADAVLIAAVFPKTTRQTREAIIVACQGRLKAYDEAKKPQK